MSSFRWFILPLIIIFINFKPVFSQDVGTVVLESLRYGFTPPVGKYPYRFTDFAKGKNENFWFAGGDGLVLRTTDRSQPEENFEFSEILDGGNGLQKVPAVHVAVAPNGDVVAASNQEIWICKKCSSLQNQEMFSFYTIGEGSIIDLAISDNTIWYTTKEGIYYQTALDGSRTGAFEFNDLKGWGSVPSVLAYSEKYNNLAVSFSAGDNYLVIFGMSSQRDAFNADPIDIFGKTPLDSPIPIDYAAYVSSMDFVPETGDLYVLMDSPYTRNTPFFVKPIRQKLKVIIIDGPSEIDASTRIISGTDTAYLINAQSSSPPDSRERVYALISEGGISWEDWWQRPVVASIDMLPSGKISSCRNANSESYCVSHDNYEICQLNHPLERNNFTIGITSIIATVNGNEYRVTQTCQGGVVTVPKCSEDPNSGYEIDTVERQLDEFCNRKYVCAYNMAVPPTESLTKALDQGGEPFSTNRRIVAGECP